MWSYGRLWATEGWDISAEHGINSSSAYTLVMEMAGEELPAKATSPALQLLLVLNAPTSPVHSPALLAAPGSGSTRATGVSPS